MTNKILTIYQIVYVLFVVSIIGGYLFDKKYKRSLTFILQEFIIVIFLITYMIVDYYT